MTTIRPDWAFYLSYVLSFGSRTADQLRSDMSTQVCIRQCHCQLNTTMRKLLRSSFEFFTIHI
jgi:hypothetical protein